MVNSVAIEKFMDRLGMGYSYDIRANEKGTSSFETVCIHLKVKNKQGRPQFKLNNCFSELGKDGASLYSTQTIMDVSEGDFSYLGDNDAVKKYFFEFTKGLAKRWFEYQKNKKDFPEE